MPATLTTLSPDGQIAYAVIANRAQRDPRVWTPEGTGPLPYAEVASLIQPFTPRRLSPPRFTAFHYILRDVAQYCCDRGLPPLTALVVNHHTWLPGRGWWGFVGEDLATLSPDAAHAIHARYVREVLSQDWGW